VDRGVGPDPSRDDTSQIDIYREVTFNRSLFAASSSHPRIRVDAREVEYLIKRLYAVCPGCDTPTIIRIGVGVAQRQRILVHCPACSSPIRGHLTAAEDVTVELNEVQLLVPDQGISWQTVTTHPDFPLDPTTKFSPFIEATMAFGDHYMSFQKAMAGFHHMIAHNWAQVERAYRFYLAQDWPRYDAAMNRLLGEEWPQEPTMLVRHDAVHRLLSIVLLPLGPNGDYPRAKDELWARARVNPQGFASFCAKSATTELLSLQRRLFDQLRRLVEIRDAWAPALALVYLDLLDRPVPDSWRLPGDDFHLLRDAVPAKLRTLLPSPLYGRGSTKYRGGPAG
jgi:hypothetical protein